MAATPPSNGAPGNGSPAATVPKTAVKIFVQVIGKCGEQKLFIYAVAEDGYFVPHAKGILLDGGIPKTFETDERGMFAYQTDIVEKERTFRVRIGENDGVNQQRAWTGVLQGR